MDSAGNLYLSDTCMEAAAGSGGTGGSGGAQAFPSYGIIWRVDAATGIISPFAGGGPVRLARRWRTGDERDTQVPAGLAMDVWNNIYIADSGNNRIRRVDAVTGIITTVAGNGTAAYAGDGGPATAASLNNPSGVAIDSDGNPELVKNNTSLTLSSSANPAIVGSAITFTAAISPSTATGSVQFSSGGSVIGTGTVANGSASFTTSSLAQGSYAITASYGGDNNDNSSTSATLTQVVNPAAPSAPSNLTATAAGSSQRDHSRRVRLPRKLYGRQPTQHQLHR